MGVQSSLARSWNWICPTCASSPLNSLCHLLLEEEQDEETRDIRLVQAWSGNTSPLLGKRAGQETRSNIKLMKTVIDNTFLKAAILFLLSKCGLLTDDCLTD